MLTIVIICFLLAQVFDAFLDNCISVAEFNRSLLRVLGGNATYFVRELSWQNKWKEGKPELGEAFWGSSTFFVWLTDGWHLLKFLRNRFYQASLSAVLSIHFSLSFFWLFILLGLVGGIVFELIYSNFEMIKKWYKK